MTNKETFGVDFCEDMCQRLEAFAGPAVGIDPVIVRELDTLHEGLVEQTILIGRTTQRI